MTINRFEELRNELEAKLKNRIPMTSQDREKIEILLKKGKENIEANEIISKKIESYKETQSILIKEYNELPKPLFFNLSDSPMKI